MHWHLVRHIERENIERWHMCDKEIGIMHDTKYTYCELVSPNVKFILDGGSMLARNSVCVFVLINDAVIAHF